jgi:hypothetical protein
MNLFRIRIRPLMIEFADMETTFAYCLKHGLLGVGWGSGSKILIHTTRRLVTQGAAISAST